MTAGSRVIHTASPVKHSCEKELKRHPRERWQKFRNSVCVQIGNQPIWPDRHTVSSPIYQRSLGSYFKKSPAMRPTTQPHPSAISFSAVPCEIDYSEPYSTPWAISPESVLPVSPSVCIFFNSIRFCQTFRIDFLVSCLLEQD